MTENKKFKILTISDHPLVPSGVGTQSRYIIEGLLKTGKYQVRSLGGAMKHADYRPQKITEYGDDWMVYPVDGYSNENIIREFIDVEKPDAIWIVTDPRFYTWLFNMSDEIRDRGIPLLYWHVWDDLPVPNFNYGYYASCDYIGCISKLTYDIVCQLGFKNSSEYIPHAVNPDIFKQFEDKQIIMKHKEEALQKNKDKFVVFYNSRNARRKMTSDVLKVFKFFLNRVGQDKGFLLMHCDPFDQEGANLVEVARMLDLTPEQIAFSTNKVPPEQMAVFYNISDVTMNISNNEGFGLSCLESLSCGTPVIVNKTGGLQDQAIDDEGNVFGALIEPATRSLTGSQQIAYIFDDRAADKDLVDALLKLYEMSWEERKALGKKAREWTLKAFPMNGMIEKWDNALTKFITDYKQNGYCDRIRKVKI